jgi:hypothetical protein
MPNRNWRAYAPLGVVLIVFALLFAAGVENHHKAGARQTQLAIQSPSPKDSSLRDTSQHAEHQRADQESFWQRTTADPIAVFTLGLLIFTAVLTAVSYFQLQGLSRSTRAFAATERAFVTMSHKAPGIDFFEGQFISALMEVRNFGGTPAKVTDTLLKPVLTPVGESLPEKPDYARDRGMPSSKAFLVANEHFNIGENFVFEVDTPRKIQNSDLWFYLIGYVDYVDVFGTRHRAGYARRYVPDRDEGPKETRNNLVLVADSAYTYDRPRRWGEGSD